MKYISKLFLSLCLMMGLGAVAAHAQIETDATVEANIPQAFIVKDTTLPAGKYTIKVLDETDPSVLEIRSANGHIAVLFDTEGTQPRNMPGKTELVFDKIGDTYFLSRIFVKGDDSGNQLPKSRMAQRLEGKGLRAEQQSVAAIKKQSKRATQSAKNGS
jgi:hypothetical protein